MKFFAAIAVVLCAAVAITEASGASSSYGSSIPSPPCPRNYLFSCQPSLQPAPCAQPAPSYGSAGAYSDNVPNYIAAPYTGQDWKGLNGFQGLAGGYQGIQGMQGIQYQ